MTRRKGWPRLFPVEWLLTQRFDALSKVPDLGLPVLFIHGSEDRLTPLEMAESLYEAAPEPKQLVVIAGAGHNNVAEVGGSSLSPEDSEICPAGAGQTTTAFPGSLLVQTIGYL